MSDRHSLNEAIASLERRIASQLGKIDAAIGEATRGLQNEVSELRELFQKLIYQRAILDKYDRSTERK